MIPFVGYLKHARQNSACAKIRAPEKQRNVRLWTIIYNPLHASPAFPSISARLLVLRRTGGFFAVPRCRALPYHGAGRCRPAASGYCRPTASFVPAGDVETSLVADVKE